MQSADNKFDSTPYSLIHWGNLILKIIYWVHAKNTGSPLKSPRAGVHCISLFYPVSAPAASSRVGHMCLEILDNLRCGNILLVEENPIPMRANV